MLSGYISLNSRSFGWSCALVDLISRCSATGKQDVAVFQIPVRVFGGALAALDRRIKLVLDGLGRNLG